MAAATPNGYFNPTNGDFWAPFFTTEYALDQRQMATLLVQMRYGGAPGSRQLVSPSNQSLVENQIVAALSRIMFEILKFGPNLSLDWFIRDFSNVFVEFQKHIPRPPAEINWTFTHEEFLTTVQSLLQTLRSVHGNQTQKTPQEHLTEFMQYYLAAALKLERAPVMELAPAENPFQRYQRDQFLQLCAQILDPSLLSSCDFSRLRQLPRQWFDSMRQLPRQGFTWMREHPGIMVFVCAGILFASLLLNSGRNSHLVYNYQEHHGSQGNIPSLGLS